MILTRRLPFWTVPALAVWVSGCGSDTATSPTSTTTATTSSTGASTVTITVTPSPVSAVASPDGRFAWSGSFVATIANTNTSPITVKSISADLQQATGGIVIVPVTGTDESFRFDVRAPFNRIDVNANMPIPFTFYYTLPNGGRESLVSLSFVVATDEGASGTVTSSVTIQ